MSDRHGNCSISSWQRALAIAAARRAAGADDEPSSRPNGSATACAGRNTRGVAARYPSEDGSDARETHRAAARVVLMHCMYARRRVGGLCAAFVDVVRVTEVRLVRVSVESLRRGAGSRGGVGRAMEEEARHRLGHAAAGVWAGCARALARRAGA